MRAMLLRRSGGQLELADVPRPEPSGDELLVKVHVCGVCRTDLHVVDGDLTEPALPLIPGHQIVGSVVACGAHAGGFSVGDRVGIPWLAGTCGHCHFCTTGRENLCEDAEYTGYQRNGGFAEYCTAKATFCLPLPESYPDLQVAPLLCAGLIGYRSYRFCGDARRLGFYGFGASAHILVQLARHHGREVYAFTRPGDEKGQAFARSLGAVWAGRSDQPAPVPLDAAIIFAPVGDLVPAALRAVDRGGRVVCAGIHMSDIPSFPYADLWLERRIVSVANLTLRDGQEFLPLAARIGIETTVHPYPLEAANQALDDLRHGRFQGAAVIVVDAGAGV